MLLSLIILALVFNFLNGVHDSSNIVATIISSRAMPPRRALALTALAEFCGPFLFGVAVAKTIGVGLLAPGALPLPGIVAALAAAILWNILTWVLGIPSSSSHALIGGMLGAAILFAGMGGILLPGLVTVLLALFLSPFAGMLAGYLFTKLVYALTRLATPRINWFFKNAQLVTGVGLALSHGANDAQKSMGIITLGLVTAGMLPDFAVPLWVIVVCGLAMAGGTATGGWSLIRTLGARIYRIRPVHGFCAQTASAAVILAAALLGGPVSTTQVVSSAIMGVGSADRPRRVRWGVAGSMAAAWLLTIPATALVSAGVYWLLQTIV